MYNYYCKFCKSFFKEGIGQIFFKNNGAAEYYCSKKCFVHKKNKRSFKKIYPYN